MIGCDLVMLGENPDQSCIEPGGENLLSLFHISNINKLSSRGDILIAAIGKANTVKKDWIKPKQAFCSS